MARPPITIQEAYLKYLKSKTNTRKDEDRDKFNKFVLNEISRNPVMRKKLQQHEKLNETFTTASIPPVNAVVRRNEPIHPDEIENYSIRNFYTILEMYYDNYFDDDMHIEPLMEQLKEYIKTADPEEVFDEIYRYIIDEDDITLEELHQLCSAAILSYLSRMDIPLNINVNTIVGLFFLIYMYIMKGKNFINMIVLNTVLFISTYKDHMDKFIALAQIPERFDTTVDEEFANLQYAIKALLNIPNNVLIDFIKQNGSELLVFIHNVIDNIGDDELYFNMYGSEIRTLAKLFLGSEYNFQQFLTYVVMNKLDILTKYEVVNVLESICTEYSEYIHGNDSSGDQSDDVYSV